MNFKIAICDDDKTAIKSLHHQLRLIEMKFDVEYEISHFQSAQELLERYSTPGIFHVIFLDVEMPDMNGLDLAHHIRNNIDKQVKIIFVSNYPEYMQDSFPTKPFDYRTKPLQESDIENLMQRLEKEYQDSRVDLAIIDRDGEKEFINIHDIYYIESVTGIRRTLNFVLKDRTISCFGIFKDWKDALENHPFIAPYRGVLVNIEHIHYINNGFITLTNQKQLPISRRQEEELKPIFARHIYSINRD